MNENSLKLPSSDTTVTSVRTVTAAEERVNNYMGHAIRLLGHLQQQNANIEISEKETIQIPQEIFTDAIKAIYKLNFTVQRKLVSDVGDLKNTIAKSEKGIVSIVRQVQIDTLYAIAQQSDAAKITKQLSKAKIAALAEGGWQARWIRFLSPISKTNQIAIAAFNVARQSMIDASKDTKNIPSLTSAVEQEKRQEFERYVKGRTSLDRRAGVIGLGEIYRLQVFFSKEEIKKQWKSFLAQDMGSKERKPIEQNFTIENMNLISQLVPLNQEFDAEIGARGTVTKVFTKIIGTKGISSLNRQEPHLINGYESSLMLKGQTLFRALRHAITSDKFEKDPVKRAENSEIAATELVKAALLQEIASQHLSIEEAQKGIELNLNSVSLVTPDDVRQFLPGQSDERKMLLDQITALKSLEDKKFLAIDGVNIPITLHVNAFNFGVNALAKDLQLGLDIQYKLNTAAMIGLREQVQKLGDHVTKAIDDFDKELSPSMEESGIDQLIANRGEINELLADIELLMQDEEAYLKGDNQYEIGAKILNLTNLMDRTIEIINQTKAPEKRISGFKAAFNCMSGKDRTGLMDAIAKTFAIMAKENDGHYRHHRNFRKRSVRKRFAEILGKVLFESGSLTVTEINTDAKGYKVGNEARLFGMPLSKFWQLLGFSDTTSG